VGGTRNTCKRETESSCAHKVRVGDCLVGSSVDEKTTYEAGIV